MESATERIPPTPCELVRVKTCGKSARVDTAMYLRGKPHPEQDKVYK